MDSQLLRIKDKSELYRLRDRCTKWTENNIEPNIGFPFFIYSPYSDTYYASEVTNTTSWDILEEYITAGNVYKTDE